MEINRSKIKEETKRKVCQIGKYIKAKRLESGLSREELAFRCFTDKSQIHKIEEGLVENITIHTILKISAALGVSMENLI